MARSRNIGENSLKQSENGIGGRQINSKYNVLPSSSAKKHSQQSWDLVEHGSLPNYLHDNEFLVHGHRPELNSVKECLKSVFMIHTETGNIWTHGLGAIGCLVLSVYYLEFVALNWQQQLVFAVFFLGAAICLGTSSIYHALICHSEPVCKFFAKMDYCGIIALIIASTVPWLYYAFYCEMHIATVYLVLGFLLGSICMMVVVQDKFREPRYRTLRFVVFMGLGLYGAIPGFHCLLFTDVLHVSGFPIWLFVMAGVYILGGLAYATRIPECYFPGKFDIWCQSHQIMHMCVIFGLLSCFYGASKLAMDRLNSDTCHTNITSWP